MSTSPWLSYYKPRPHPRLRLFCLPYAGGGASLFRSWADELPGDVEVLPIQLPGRESRLLEPPFTQIMPLVGTLTHVLHPYLDMPFAVFGHSMGALISFELVRQLRMRYGLTPELLFVAGCTAPDRPRPKLPGTRDSVSGMAETLRYLQGTPNGVLQNPELLQLMLPGVRADLDLCEAYTYSAAQPLDCPIFAFGGDQDPLVSWNDLFAWRKHTCATFSLKLVPGDHFFPRSAQSLLLQTISRDLMERLERDRVGVPAGHLTEW